MSALGRSPLPIAVVLAVALWLGAVAFFSIVVAPAAFRVLPTRTLAGALVGASLPALFWIGALVGVGALAVALVTGASGWRRTLAIVAAIAMIATTLTAQLVIAPRIARLRSELPSTLEQVAADDPRRAAFGRLHGVSVVLLGAGALAAVVLVAALTSGGTARDP